METLEILITLLLIIFSFFVSFFLTSFWIKKAKAIGLIGYDMNKVTKKPVAEAGGIAFIVSLTLSLFLYLFFKTFVLKSSAHLVEILTLIVTLVLAGLIGFIDDILGWKKGIKGWQKVVLTIPLGIPLAVININQTTIFLPFIGNVDFGIFYSLFLVPLAIIGCSNGYNLLAGYNGLEAGLGIIIFSSFTGVFLITNQPYLALISCLIVFSLLGFLVFNFYPAKIFPGNVLTYSLGSLIALLSILGNVERFGFILFIPFIMEGILKARSKFKAENFAKIEKGNLVKPYKKIFSLTHFVLALLNKIKKRTTELDVVLTLYLFQLIFSLLAFFNVLVFRV
jgi:UDP-N-acetylglucosamine--dolichyl-phosphate N-acetylglucosaminephosphotransferase